MLQSSARGSRSSDRPDRYRAFDRAADGAGHRGPLPAGAGRAAPARRRLSRGGRVVTSMRRRPLAHRDGPPVPGLSSWSASSSSRTPWPWGAPTSPRPASPSASRIRQARSTRPGEGGDYDSPTSSTRSTSCPIRSARCAPPGRRSHPGAGSSCSTGRCRRRRRTSEPLWRAISRRPAGRAVPGDRSATRERFLRKDRRRGPAGAGPHRPAVRGDAARGRAPA